MDRGLPAELMHQLSERLAEQMGLHFPQQRWRELEAAVQATARELLIADTAEWIRSLQSARLTQEQIEKLAGALTTGETYFLREKSALAALSEHIFPELIRARRESGRRLRIWSAGCCTGEEPYSIAILLERILGDLREWQVTILATDVNPHFLRSAAQGTYGEWSFRDAPAWLKENYFQPVDEHRYAILPRIRERVRFAYLNLAESGYPSLANDTQAMDVILCRNVLMYFSPETAARVVDNFHRSLVEGGWLLVGAVETSGRLFSRFVARQFEGALCYQKSEAAFVPSPGFDVAAPVPSDAVVWQSASTIEPCATPPPNASATLPSEAGAYEEALTMAKMHANLGELAEAQRSAEQAIAVDKLNSASHYLRAMILQERNLLDEALISLRRAMFLSPDFILGHFALGNLVRRQGRGSQARRHFTNALALLRKCDDADVLPCSDGLRAKQLREMIESILLTDFTA